VGPSIPDGSLIRYLAGGIGGLLLGLFLTLGIERIKPRIRNAEGAERNFGVPLLARIPRMPRKQRRYAPVAVAQVPSSQTADAFRVLAAGILRWPSLARNLNSSSSSGVSEESSDNGSQRGARVLTIDKSSIDAGPSRPRHSILITSAASGEGKTTVVANLASAFAEMGKKTVVLSCDLRNPEVHELLKVHNETGLIDALESGKTPLLTGRLLQSPLHESNINVLPSGPTPPNPAELLNSDEMRSVIDEACRQADIVLLDTPPILAAMDVGMLVSEVDAVLVIARSGKTSVKVADSTSEMLNKLGAPYLGVVLNCSTDIVKPRSYYRGILPQRRSGSSAPMPRSKQSA
jgi:capsular exopolysaccharide synthesis family protein